MTEIKVIGSGTVTQHPIHGGRAIQIKAIPDIGATFVRWEKWGRVLSTFSVCNLNLPLIRGAIVAVFSEENAEGTQLLESTLQLENSELKKVNSITKQHSIILKNTGSGGGVITMNPQKERFSFGEKVSLKAVADDDSYFKAWEIHANNQLVDDERLKENAELTMTTPNEGEEKIICINAIFESLFTEKEANPNEFIRAVLKSRGIEGSGGNEKYIYALQLFNLKDFAINIKVPLTDKVIDNVKKVPQKKWGGSINGTKGIALEVNGFCEIVLVYLEEWMPNEEIRVAVELSNLEINLILKFRAPKKGWLSRTQYRLVDCQLKGMEGKVISKTSNKELMRLLDRVDALEASLSNALSRIDFLEQHPSVNRLSASNGDQLALNSFDDVMDWLLEAETVTLADLRARLLPLNLLIGAVIADLNEKAIDQTGDLALEDDGDQVVVNRSILQKVLRKV